MAIENEELFLTLCLAREIHSRETDQLIQEGYISGFSCLSPKGEAFIKDYIGEHKAAVLASMQKHNCNLVEVRRDLGLKSFSSLLKICDHLCNEGDLVHHEGHEYAIA